MNKAVTIDTARKNRASMLADIQNWIVEIRQIREKMHKDDIEIEEMSAQTWAILAEMKAR